MESDVETAVSAVPPKQARRLLPGSRQTENLTHIPLSVRRQLPKAGLPCNGPRGPAPIRIRYRASSHVRQWFPEESNHRNTCDSTKHRARRTSKVSPRMKRSSLSNGRNRQVNTGACGSTRPAVVVSRPLLPKANGAMMKSRSYSGTKIIRTAESAQHSPTAKAPTPGAGLSITKATAR
jgi:hypothetical protein